MNNLGINGTFLNGKLLGKGKQEVLRSGDTICLVNPHSPDSLKYTWKYIATPLDTVVLSGRVPLAPLLF